MYNLKRFFFSPNASNLGVFTSTSAFPTSLPCSSNRRGRLELRTNKSSLTKQLLGIRIMIQGADEPALPREGNRLRYTIVPCKERKSVGERKSFNSLEATADPLPCGEHHPCASILNNSVNFRTVTTLRHNRRLRNYAVGCPGTNLRCASDAFRKRRPQKQRGWRGARTL